MVPHLKIEEAIAAAGALNCCVTSIADDRRGERLAPLYVHAEMDPAAYLRRLSDTDLPKLWLPKREDLHHVDYSAPRNRQSRPPRRKRGRRMLTCRSRADPLVRGWPPGQPFRCSSKAPRTRRVFIAFGGPPGHADKPSRSRFFVGQVGNLRPIVNRPAGSAYDSQAKPLTPMRDRS